ncbi:PadR family transcriptional regulator [Nonomuraea gerenzanensis]|uniref:Transcriptional regulator, PadR family n=1 Tax=Nonomuraea gerenzanensis TaxID=93944 RepID=A0A1M4EJU7_9ACTN|nr:PadR family transcriptional regulator [Nonomuraea gerenzanensis]UBU10730.1 PadR family transcriptional regulator [Nonomuraea gerenzanensis]SBO99157.1 Transcriptional regulator, PadR family [Nonomuraea gerenzanensis]
MTHHFAASGPWPGAHEYKRALRETLHAMGDAFEHLSGHHGERGGERGGDRGGPHDRRHRGRRGGSGPFPFDFGRGGPFGPGGPWGGGHRGWGGGRGRKAKRGDVRAAILALLSEEPRNGYQIIQEIAERSEGGWKPSPGAVYPALQQLTDEGLVISEENEGRKTFRLTEEGRGYIEAHADEVRAPWDEMRPDIDDNTADLWHIARQSAFAMMQILQTGNDAQIREARKTLVETRRKLYQILADDEPGEE